MASTQPPKWGPRQDGLTNFYFKVVARGECLNSQHGKIFLSALVIQPNPVKTLDHLMDKNCGAEILRSALFSQASSSFMNNEITAFLDYLRQPEVKSVHGGSFLQNILWTITETPLFWHAFLRQFQARTLSDGAVSAFAWLLLELISLPDGKAQQFYTVAEDSEVFGILLEADKRGISTNTQKIQSVLKCSQKHQETPTGERPGWRHDNDHEDIRAINILPTADELQCTESPFIRRASEVEEVPSSTRFATHVDNQFRMLREDMMRELKEELHPSQRKKLIKRPGFRIHHLALEDVKCEDRRPWSLQLRCESGLPELAKLSEPKRVAYLKEHPKYLRHESIGCILADNQPLTLVELDRDEDLLARSTPRVCVKFGETDALSKILLSLKKASDISLVMLNTAVFSYRPILRQLQRLNSLELGEELINADQATPLAIDSSGILSLVADLQLHPSMDLSEPLQLGGSTVLDRSQALCLEAGLMQRVSAIQGTGKSFTGALIAKAIYIHTQQTILVVCYTNHALDQFLDDLLKVGIPRSTMVRIGGSARTAASVQDLMLKAQLQSMRFAKLKWTRINEVGSEIFRDIGTLETNFREYNEDFLSRRALKTQADLDLNYPEFCGAFDVPEENDGLQRIGRKGKVMDEFYLLERWCKGRNAGVFPGVASQHRGVWTMAFDERKAACERWKCQILELRAHAVAEAGLSLDQALSQRAALFAEKTHELLAGKRIIACTTTGAAKYVQDIQSVSPDVLLVEEAGEILESHILTALGPNTKQLVLIGDHQQLRPKVHYDLSQAKGEGYDLDVSLFERLVMKGYPHQSLSQQHRMRPQIASLVRNLTYHNLTDAPSTRSRPNVRGLQSNLVFINHYRPEDELKDVKETRDPSSGSSKRNTFEAEMTLKCVRYLAQQGYGTDDIVVLTPYLAQLRLMMDVLRAEADPILNDLDSFDLVRAGLMPNVSGTAQKRRLRISSIDNYQGEQSDIVIVSLTRSNPKGDIGFLSAPERLNVLLSRARNGMILIGNSETFVSSPRGRNLWQRLIDLLSKAGNLYDGLPVVCAQHPDRKGLMTSPDQFEESCPDGGCTEPCGAILQCGKHQCPQRCHQLSDHSKMRCLSIESDKCSAGHELSWQCFKLRPPTCKRCEQQAKQDEKRKEAQQRAQQQIDAHQARIAIIEAEIQAVRDAQVHESKSKELQAALRQKIIDLEIARKLAASQKTPAPTPPDSAQKSEEFKTAAKSSTENTIPRQSHQKDHVPRLAPSTVETEWQRQKEVESADVLALDELMKMTGLQKVKQCFLNIKTKIETTKRQGTDLAKERLHVTLLGNPGTGKTTVARLYAKFLTSMGALPGSVFEETTGARLANNGVPGAQEMLEKIVKGGGGAIFIDEAYQLASGNSYGGSAVLDFLLAEIENLTGVVVFILAGYNKQMEKFFQHNQGFSSRVPHSLQFDDYSDTELLHMFESKIEAKYKGQMKVEDGVSGLFARVAIGRLGRTRGSEGFGNARALENLISGISGRQSERLQKHRIAGNTPDDFQLTKEDVIGPDPSQALIDSKAWEKLQKMIGLSVVKSSVQSILNRISSNYVRELQEKPIVEVSLNRVFLGSPGTGKTSIGKLYGQILKDIGCLSNGEVMVKNPSDFVGSVLGESEKNTRAILESSKGKVLIIDEAYMLHSGSQGGQNTTDPYKTAVVHTIVAEIQSTPGEDRCVLLLGYREQMEAMFQHTNPGLARRFPLDDAFVFEDFDETELMQILALKLDDQGLLATDEAKKVALGVLSRARKRMNFGNAGEVENLITKAKNHYEKRFNSVLPLDRPIDMTFEPEDFDSDHKRVQNATANCQELFKDVVGCEDVISKLEGYIRTTTNLRARNKDPTNFIPFNFIFKGPPGTGKTTTARKMGKIFYDMGLLSTDEVHECSASELIGQYVGQTAPKTTALLEKALGRVLFIDEAYRLGEGLFATEAVNELVDSLTKDKFRGKLIVILAGYEDAMNQLLGVNQGLGSRFSEEVLFKNLTPESCLALLEMTLAASDISIQTGGLLTSKDKILGIFEKWSRLRSFGNGRDVDTFAKSVAGFVFSSSNVSEAEFSVTYATLADRLDQFLAERSAREQPQGSAPLPDFFRDIGLQSPPLAPIAPQPAPPISAFAANTAPPETKLHEQTDQAVESKASLPEAASSPQRDPGVSDAAWDQLQRDRTAQEGEEKRLEAAVAESEAQAQRTADEEARLAAAEAKAAEDLQKAQLEQERIDEAKKAHEEARLKRAEAARRAHEAEEQRKRALQEAETEKRREEKAQKKLASMGVCPVGFRWIKQGGGYVCAGGYHFVSSDELGLL